jgi:hypothetical protein
MNSVDDIIRDRVVLHRERNLSVRLPYYVFSKFGTLSLFSAIQSALFVVVGNYVLEIRDMFWPYFIFLFVTAASGTSLGLLISSLSTSGKMAANFVPLVLIPQLIFGGALIKYEEMNRDLDAIYSIRRWFTMHPGATSPERNESELEVPLISRFVATHYTYEALIVAQAKLNPLSKRQDQLQRLIDGLVAKQDRTPEDDNRLEDLKDTLAMVSGLESGSVPEVEKRLRRVDGIINGKPLDMGGLRSRTTGVTAERLYTNQKVTDLVSKAEIEQSHYRRRKHVNAFFGPVKHYHFFDYPAADGTRKEVAIRTNVFVYNTAVLVLSSIAMLCALYLVLKRQLRTRGT